MARLLTQLLVWFLVVWMPVHAAAAPLMMGHCEKPLAHELQTSAVGHGDAHAHAGQAFADAAGSESMVPDEDARNSASGDGLCCFHLSGFVSFTCPVAVSFDDDAPVTQVRSAYTFFPDQPQRPPRA